MSRLKRDNPALQARDQLKYQKLERALADGLAQRSGRKSDRLKARLRRHDRHRRDARRRRELAQRRHA